MGEWDVILLDDGGVGKTALIIQLTLNCWLADTTQTYDPTIEHGFRKQLLVDNRVCFLKVIDTGGQEEFSSLRDHWIRESQGSILVYSIASRSTFDRLQIFRQAFRSNQRRGEPIMVLVGNKSDKSHEREVTFEEGAALAQDFGCEFLETSAKTAENLAGDPYRAFVTLVRALRQVRYAQSQTLPTTGKGGIRKRIAGRCVFL
ncbi:P-loop containing nucleoside triphosphate hydrolase protein [Mycena vulgaris]|nr:P-loop containing nucleoside triphosphate hydrolase protein [Mycena vulgaris]